MIELSELLDPSRMRCQCNIRSKKRAVQTLAELLAPSVVEILTKNNRSGDKRPEDKGLGEGAEEQAQTDMDIFDALITRERLGSTALGHGVALPHSRLANIKEPIAAMITLSNGVDFEAQDEKPVDLLIGLLVPERCNDEHLKILAALAQRFSNNYFRDELRTFGTDQAEALYAFLQQPAPAA